MKIEEAIVSSNLEVCCPTGGGMMRITCISSKFELAVFGLACQSQSFLADLPSDPMFHSFLCLSPVPKYTKFKLFNQDPKSRFPLYSKHLFHNCTHAISIISKSSDATLQGRTIFLSLPVVAVEVEDQDGDTPPPSEPIFHSGLDASTADSQVNGVGG